MKKQNDLRKFMESMMGQKIPSFPKKELDAKEQA